MLFADTCGLCKHFITRDEETELVWLPTDPEWGTNCRCHKECAAFFREHRPSDEERKQTHKEVHDEFNDRSETRSPSGSNDSGDSAS